MKLLPPKRPTNYYEEILLENNFHPDFLEFSYISDEGQRVHRRVIEPDMTGNTLRIVYPEVISPGVMVFDPKGNAKAPKEYIVERPKFLNPGQKKYKAPSAPPQIFVGPWLANCCWTKVQLTGTFTLLEGAKKDLHFDLNQRAAASMGGKDLFFHTKDKQNQIREINPNLDHLLRIHNFDRIVLFLDGDLFNLASTTKDPADRRPRDFLRAVLRFKAMFDLYDLDLFLAYPNSGMEKGFDDQVNAFRPLERLLFEDFDRAIAKNGKSKYYTAHNIRVLSDSAIRKLFHLDGVEQFYGRYKEELQPWLDENEQTFKFGKTNYRVTEEGKVVADENQWEPNEIFTRKNAYYAWKKGSAERISNFVMDYKFRIWRDMKQSVLVQVVTNANRKINMIADMEVLTTSEKFRVAASHLGMSWLGNTRQLMLLYEKLYHNADEARERNVLGQTEQGYIWGNGIHTDHKFIGVDEFGMVEVDETRVFLPAFSKIAEQLYGSRTAFEAEQKFKFTPECPLTWEKYADLILACFPQHAKTALAWLVSVFYSDIVFKRTDFFPLLGAFGNPQSGKTALGNFLAAIWNTERINVEDNSTTVEGVLRTLAQYNNAIVRIDEYKNSVNPKIVGMLKKLWGRDAAVKGIATGDNQRRVMKMTAAAYLSGQDLPTQDTALYSRLIYLSFGDKTSWDTETEFDQLSQAAEIGLSGLCSQFLALRETVAKKFPAYFESARKEIKENLTLQGVSDRLVANAAAVAGVAGVLMKQSDIYFPFNYAELIGELAKKCSAQEEIFRSAQESSIFWDVFELLVREYAIKNGQEFSVIGNELRFRFKIIYQLYDLKLRGSKNSTPLDKASLRLYLRNHESYLDSKTAKIGNDACHAMIFYLPATGLELPDIPKIYIDHSRVDEEGNEGEITYGEN